MNILNRVDTLEKVRQKTEAIIPDFSSPERSFATQKKAVLLGDYRTFRSSIDPETQNADLIKLQRGLELPNANFFSQLLLVRRIEEDQDFVRYSAKLTRQPISSVEMTYHKHANIKWLLNDLAVW